MSIKKILFLFAVLCTLNSFSQEIKYKEYSYTEVFDMIATEKDSVFKLSNAFVRFNPKTDSLFTGKIDGDFGNVTSFKRKKPLLINTQLVFNDVHFFTKKDYNLKTTVGILNNIVFKKSVSFTNTLSTSFISCVFEEKLKIRTGSQIENALTKDGFRNYDITINSSKLLDGADVFYMCMDLEKVSVAIEFSNNDIYFKNRIRSSSQQDFHLLARNISSLELTNNRFHSVGTAEYRAIENIFHNITKNKFNNTLTKIFISDTNSFDRINITENVFNKPVLLDLVALSAYYRIPYQQFKEVIYMNAWFSHKSFNKDDDILSEKYINEFYKSRITNEIVYDDSMAFKGMLYNFYKAKFDTQDANAVYVDMKNLETERLQYLHKLDPSFKSYFTVKINQFLNVFSAYGTEPARAVVFSMYVILIFAFIYLLFPNSWDAHGRKRIMNRYAFFFTYMNKKAGIHEVYKDNQKENLLEFDEFKTLVNEQGKTVPKFFTATAMPLYRWAVSGTKFSARILKRVDIMKGTWSDLPSHKRFWKSFLLIGAFIIAICYDILIKMLNALMLSINTFTTLGFGEIPIKGLPRYLAIIQGFIGWFMLTIFSVSLISQLLN